MKKSKSKDDVHFHVELSGVQKATIVASLILILLIGGVTVSSPTVKLPVFGLFLQLIGSIILGLGVIKTNDELVDLADHHEDFNRQRFISHMTKDRFFIVLGVFLIAVGILLQIISGQLDR